MKGEQIIAQLIALVGMIVYVVLIQHLYAELLHEPEQSWIRKGRLWWLTRHSEKHRVKLAKVWDLNETSEEP